MELNRLQKQLAHQIVQWLNQQPLQIGSKVSTSELARTFGVSRSPVRAALSWLAEQQQLEPASGRGFLLAQYPIDLTHLALDPQQQADQQLYQRLVEDMVHSRIAEECSETDLMKRYQVERPLLLEVLQQLDKEGVVQRKPGRGWQFRATLDSQQAFDESYQYRKLLEPQAPLQPGFSLDLEQAKHIRQQQQQLLAQERADAQEIFEANADFHEFIAACSHNRFLLQAVQQQNKLRRFVEYQYRWQERPKAITKSCQDHLNILDALEAGNLQRASHLLWIHLDRTSNMSPTSTKIDTQNWQEKPAS